jgi:hypothetical protein
MFPSLPFLPPSILALIQTMIEQFTLSNPNTSIPTFIVSSICKFFRGGITLFLPQCHTLAFIGLKQVHPTPYLGFY